MIFSPFAGPCQASPTNEYREAAVKAICPGVKEAAAQTGGDPMDKKKRGAGRKHTHSRVLSRVQNISVRMDKK